MHPSSPPDSSLISEGSGEPNQALRGEHHGIQGGTPSRPASFPEQSLQPIAGTDEAEGGEGSAGAVGATRVLAPTAPRRPTRAVSSDFEGWEATVGKVHPWRPSFPLAVTRAGRRWPGAAAASLISPGGTDSDAGLGAAQVQCGSQRGFLPRITSMGLPGPTWLPTSSRNRVLGSLWGISGHPHTPWLVTAPPHHRSLQFHPGQQTDLSLPPSTLTLVFESWGAGLERGWQGTGDASGCYGTERSRGAAGETPETGGPVSGGLDPKLQAPSFQVEIEDVNKEHQRN